MILGKIKKHLFKGNLDFSQRMYGTIGKGGADVAILVSFGTIYDTLVSFHNILSTSSFSNQSESAT